MYMYAHTLYVHVHVCVHLKPISFGTFSEFSNLGFVYKQSFYE